MREYCRLRVTLLLSCEVIGRRGRGNVYAWLTPDYETGYVGRSLYIPKPLADLVTGALLQLCEEYNYEAFGDMTEAECASLACIMVDEYVMSDMSMIGQIAPFATSAAPAGWLLCDGAEYDRVDYPDLYAVLDSVLIVDADTFNVPDLRDRVVIGASATNDPGDDIGEATHTLTADEMPAHDHDYMEKSEILFPYGDNLPQISARGTLLEGSRTTTSEGGGDPHNNIQPSQAWDYYMRYR